MAGLSSRHDAGHRDFHAPIHARSLSLLAGAAISIASMIAAPATANAAPIIYRNIPYADHFAESFFICVMDLYIPANSGGPWPTVIWIHGGSWSGGIRFEAAADAARLTAMGYAVAAIEYRFSQIKPWPAQIHDCKGAARWLRGHAQQYHLDSDRFIAWGESAGGHLAAVLATSAGNAELEGTAAGYLEYSSAVQGCIDFYGPTRFLAMTDWHLQCNSSVSRLIGACLADVIANQEDPDWAPWVHACNTADPTWHITPDDPPFFICHGTADTLDEPTQSILLHNELVTAGVSSEFHLVDGMGHGRTPATTELAMAFIQREFPPPPVPDDPGSPPPPPPPPPPPSPPPSPPIQPMACPDATGNGNVGLDDIAMVIQRWAADVAPGTLGDVTNDGKVSLPDIAAVIQHWAEECVPNSPPAPPAPPPPSPPEPPGGE
ncbi:MAG TPA: alpha/beta hydrolase fold domain-containing protein [Phycisphaerales bacterium]|nr:alpha/beta hydrolase fold domain-containing protein [Phycisphaerales bacterium]